MSESAILSNQLEEAHSPYGAVELPCGYIHKENLLTHVLVREITGHEEDMLGSDKIKPLQKLTELIARCVVSIDGIDDRAFIVEAAKKMTIGDRAAIILGIRRFTLGEIFPYQQVCPSLNCKEKCIYQVDLSTIEFHKMPDPMRRVYEVPLPKAKKTARFHVMTGEDEERVAKFQTDQISQLILARLESIGDVTPSLMDVKRLHMLDRNELREKFADVEGGVDTEIEMACPKCGYEFSMELDIGQAGFFFPSQIQSRSKRKSSS